MLHERGSPPCTIHDIPNNKFVRGILTKSQRPVLVGAWVWVLNIVKGGGGGGGAWAVFCARVPSLLC
jgi:hypothetical protein